MQRKAAFLFIFAFMKLTVPYLEIPHPERDALPFDAIGEKCQYIGNERLTAELAQAIVAARPDYARLFVGLPEITETKSKAKK